MQHINEIISSIKSTYRGSLTTAKQTAEVIKQRYGIEEAQKYDPYTNCLTYRSWMQNGYKVKRGEHAIPSVTFIDRKNESGEVIATYPKRVHLFYYLQVEPITN